MAHWHDTMVDRPETDGAVYVTGWTISGLAVLGAVVVVWLLGIEPERFCAAFATRTTKHPILSMVLVDAQGIEPWTSPV